MLHTPPQLGLPPDSQSKADNSSQDQAPIVEVTGLYKIFGAAPERVFEMLAAGASKEHILRETGCVVAIDNVSFSVQRGEVFVIMGLSGSGKSTIIRCINRLIEPTKGQIAIAGVDIVGMNDRELLDIRRTKMSMVFQHFGLLPHRDVMGNVEYGLEISGVDQETRRERAQEAIEQVGLSGYERSMPSELSGGMQQRVGLARALANNPDILLMDEAFSALDPLIRAQMQDELIDLQQRLRKTILFITHDLDEALRIGDRIAILGPGGQLMQIGAPEQILTNPANEYVRSFVQGVDRTQALTAQAMMQMPATLTISDDDPQAAIDELTATDEPLLYALDDSGALLGTLSPSDIEALPAGQAPSLEDMINDDLYTTSPNTSVRELVTTAALSEAPIAVVEDDGQLLGVIEPSAVFAEFESDSSEATSLRDIRNQTADKPSDQQDEETDSSVE